MKQINIFCRSLLAFIFIAVLSYGCLSDKDEEVSVNTTGESLEEIVDKIRQTSDPKGLYRNCKTYVMKQILEFDKDTKHVSYMVEVKFKQPGMMKTTTYENGKPISITLFKDNKAWNIDPESGKSTPIKGQGLELVKIFSAMANPANTIITIFDHIDVQTVMDKESGNRYYKLICYPKAKDLPTYTMYVGEYSFLTKKLETMKYVMATNGQFVKVPYVSYIDKYAEHDGVKIASITTVVLNKTNKFNYKVIDFDLDQPIPDSEFDLPVPWYIQTPDVPLSELKKDSKSPEAPKAPKGK